MVTLAYPALEEVATGKITKLELIHGMFEAFHLANIVYCHWKSNEHLDASMSGDTDLDVLFDYNSRGELEKILAELHFVRFESVAQKKYIDIEDYIGLDVASGKVIHLHAHFRLTLGEPYLKGYQLKVDRQLLDLRVFDKDFGLYHTNPAYELILLFCRQALKLRNRDKLKLLLNKGTKIAPNLGREYEWLRNRCSTLEICHAAEKMFSDSRLKEIFVGPLSKKQFAKLSGLLRNELKDARIYHPFVALMIRWRREFILKIKRKLVARTQRPIVTKRFHPESGLVVAVVGADGSGKSTVIKNLHSTFTKKLDVYPIYFGSGGFVSISTRILKMFGKKKPAVVKVKSSRPSTPIEKKSGFLKTFFNCLNALEVAMLKSRNLDRMCAAKEKGMLVICDRYPQSQVMGYNDGPHLNGFINSSNFLFRWMARKERRIFSRFNHVSPDIVFKLLADARLIESRKPGQTPLPVLEKKIAAIVNLRFPENISVVTVDASRPLDNVLQTIKSKIWEKYN